jgi:hypothetical protein
MPTIITALIAGTIGAALAIVLTKAKKKPGA